MPPASHLALSTFSPFPPSHTDYAACLQPPYACVLLGPLVLDGNPITEPEGDERGGEGTAGDGGGAGSDEEGGGEEDDDEDSDADDDGADESGGEDDGE